MDEEYAETLGIVCLEAADYELDWGVFLVMLAILHSVLRRTYHVGQREARHVKQNRLNRQQPT